VSPAEKGGGHRPELRILLASLLSMIVILAWAKYFAPKPPPHPPEENKPAATAPASEATPAASPAGTSTAQAQAPQPKSAPTPTIAPVSDTQERTIVVENALYRVEFSNRGGVVKSWKLKGYKDDAKPPRVLDLVHPQASQQVGRWPFGLVLNDAEVEKEVNAGLYQVKSGGAAAPAKIEAPGELDFSWSNGHVEVTKRFHFDHSYVVKTEISAKQDGRPITAGLAWLGGFGDLTVTNPTPVETVQVFYNEGGKLTTLPHKKLEDLNKLGQGAWQGGKDWTGIEDRYFAAAFLPLNGAEPGTLETRYWNDFHTVQTEGKDTSEPVPEVATATTTQPTELRVFVGPKEYDQLKKMTPPLQSLVNFGWLEIIAAPLFYALKWLHNYVPNWGWAIVALTVLINTVLFPMRIWTYRSTLKMQSVAPEIKAIQNRYKKYKMNDPRKQEMNKEVMAVYKREGINPIGGCIPQLLQMPIWFGLYRALEGTIELRHAPWFWWIKDLSAKDPYYILPILMGVLMYFSTKITPMPAAGDPQQQMMMKIMPIGMAGFFVIIPYPSGLAVYIVAQYLIGIVQQVYLNKTHPLPQPGSAKAGVGKAKTT
jgi:YidC/Oxa1 family membrane protein insertase